MRGHVLGESHRPSPQEISDCDGKMLQYLVRQNRLDLALFPTENMKHACLFLTLQKWLVYVVRTFKENNIFVIVLKGIPLNHLLYGERCIRRSKDIDLWVSPDQLVHAHRCLLGLGFVLDSALSPEELETSSSTFLKESIVDFTYNHASEKISIELHQRTQVVASILFPDPETCSFVTILDTRIPILNLETYFVYLCAHAASHHWSRLQWLVDLAIFYMKFPLDWTMVMKVANETASVRALYESLTLLRSFFKLDTPSFSLSLLDRFSIWYRLKFFRKIWHKPLSNSRILFLSTLLYPYVSQKYRLTIGTVFNTNLCRGQISRYPTHPMWVILFTVLFSHYIKREFRYA
ncbi:MAG: hypothetical protein EXS67_03025 [Candidatus Margulisbacteria bacterium]|nr:hypothetical protein [Candidatus Margulisiibacteriota bacterium]